MLACIEWLERGRFGIVRVGPRCARYSSPFDYAAGFHRAKYGPPAVTVKGLVADGRLTQKHQRAVNGALKRFFPVVTWKRFKKWPRARLVSSGIGIPIK